MRERDFTRLEFEKVKEWIKERLNSKATEELLDSLLPKSSKEEILQEIDLCISFANVENLSLYPFEDIRGLLKRSRLEGAVLSATELLTLSNVLSLIREVRKKIGFYAEKHTALRRLSRRLYIFSSLENLINSSIDRRGFVKDSASEELFRIRKSIRGIEKEIMDRLESLFRRPDSDKVFGDKIITLRNNRYVVPVKSSQVKKVFGIVHGTSSSGYTTYIEPQFVVELNNKLTELKEEEDTQVRKVLRRITTYIGEQANKIEESFGALVEIDLLSAKAHLIREKGWGFPSIEETVHLKSVKHPLLALSSEETVPIDITFGDSKGLILTGPNTGGKTVALKTLGLIVLMVQSAMPVPVSEGSKLKVFEKVFVDIGDEQSIEQNLSTFSSHMKNLSEFLPLSDENTLVLLDELGAGTDPVEGSALGVGVLEYLKKRGAWVFANTHHMPIKAYAVNSEYFTPASVLFDKETLKPLYKIAYNTVGESMAFEVARQSNIPEEVLSIALRSIESAGRDYKSAMEKLSDYTREYQEKLSEIERLKRELEEEKKKYEELYREYEEFKKRAWREAYREAKSYLRKLLTRGEEVLKSAKSLGDIEEFVKEQEKQLALFVPKEAPQNISVGDMVEFMGKRGKVSLLKGDKAYVNLEGMKLWVNLDALRKIDKVDKKPNDRSEKQLTTKREINLMGMDANTALIELEKFIEEAHSAGYKSVKVVHGIGKGILKRAVQEFLSRSPKVRFYREAYPREGGAGVTVVYMKGSED